MNFVYHDPAPPVYTKLPPVNGITRIGTPERTKPRKVGKLGLSRRDRTLLVVAVKRREVDLSNWSAADLARLFGASPRSTCEASRLSLQERQAIASGDRPLFPRHSSVPAPSPVFNARAAVARIAKERDADTVLDLLSAEYERVATKVAA